MQTEALAREHNLTIARLPQLTDIDTIAEYDVWQKHLGHSKKIINQSYVCDQT